MVIAGQMVSEDNLQKAFLLNLIRKYDIISMNMDMQHIQKIVRSCADEFQVKSVWMFGSALENEQEAADIDLAVEGLAPEKFFEFYGRLFLEIPQPVDLVDLSQNPPIAAIIRKKGVRIYERGK